MDFDGECSIARCEAVKPPANPIAHENCRSRNQFAQFDPDFGYFACPTFARCRETICVDVFRPRVLVRQEDKTWRSSWCELRRETQRKITVVDFFPFCTGFIEYENNFLPSTHKNLLSQIFLLRVLFFLASADTYKCPIFRGLLKSKDTCAGMTSHQTIHYVTFSLLQATIACFHGKSLRDTGSRPSSHRQRPTIRSSSTRKSQFSFFFARDAFANSRLVLAENLKATDERGL